VLHKRYREKSALRAREVHFLFRAHSARYAGFGSTCLTKAALMRAMQLQSNKDLLEFLLRFATELEARGETQLAEDVMFASRFASGSASEFLHEAHQILTRIDGSKPSVLTTEQSGRDHTDKPSLSENRWCVMRQAR